MLIAIITLAVLSVFNTFLIFGTLVATRLTRREVNESVDALCSAQNFVSTRVTELHDVTLSAMDCLVRYDAVMSEEDEE